MLPGRREEVLNTLLAVRIATHGIDADPETILRGGKSRPDVMVKFRGLRCALEGKLGDAPQACRSVLADAQGRINQGIAHIAIAVVYPTELRTAEFSGVDRDLAEAVLSFAVLTESETGNWHSGGVTEIVAELRRAHDVIVRDDVLQQAVSTLSVGLAEVADALMSSKGTCDRLVKLLGVGNKSNATSAV
ncbi:MAG: hypothetical protein ACJ8ER_16405 [Allosphingosinicella sp.]